MGIDYRACAMLNVQAKGSENGTYLPGCPPPFPIVGQFRDGTQLDISMEDALAQGQLLAAHTEAFVHLYEPNVVTSGELIVEVANNQMGMGVLHSTLPTSGAVVAAVLGCVEAKGKALHVFNPTQQDPNYSLVPRLHGM